MLEKKKYQLYKSEEIFEPIALRSEAGVASNLHKFLENEVLEEAKHERMSN